MLEGSETKRSRNCWVERTDLEKGLMAFLVLTTLLISILGAVMFLHTNSTFEPCKTPACVKSASEILNRIDTNINPCEDFYAFACNNMPKNTKPGYNRPLVEMVEKEMSRIEEMYMEPIMEDDFPLVKVQKIMYEACMNQTAIADDASPTLKEILKIVGGWPVLEELWNAAKFDWVQTTYKLRQLGYVHNSFLELKIVPDPNNTDKYMFEISIPTVRHVYSKWFDSDENSGFMTDVALALGAEVHRAFKEMTETYQFLNHLQWQRNSIMDEKVPFHSATVAEFQQREDAIDWVEFINTIAGPDVPISINDVVLFPPERALDDWLGELNRTPKRTLANYMLWRVVEEALPYLTEQLIHGNVKPRMMANARCSTRSEFCIEEIDRRFSPSPINIMYLRKYLPKAKREAVEEMVNNMKSAFLDGVIQLEWMDVLDREKITNEINELPIVIGAPGNYFDDKIFDMKFDVDISTNNFLKMLSQANRNNLDRLYSLIDKSPQDTAIVWTPITTKELFLSQEKKNKIIIKASVVQDPIFNAEQPNYLNYANLGILGKYHFLDFFAKAESNQTMEAMQSIADCLVFSTISDNTSVSEYVPVRELIGHNLAVKVSHEAYKKWAKDQKEPPLAAIDYTPQQLFWMSSGYLFCQYTDPQFIRHWGSQSEAIFTSTVPKVINSNPNLARDFECPETPEEICKIF